MLFSFSPPVYIKVSDLLKITSRIFSIPAAAALALILILEYFGNGPSAGNQLVVIWFLCLYSGPSLIEIWAWLDSRLPLYDISWKDRRISRESTSLVLHICFLHKMQMQNVVSFVELAIVVLSDQILQHTSLGHQSVSQSASQSCGSATVLLSPRLPIITI